MADFNEIKEHFEYMCEANFYTPKVLILKDYISLSFKDNKKVSIIKPVDEELFILKADSFSYAGDVNIVTNKKEFYQLTILLNFCNELNKG